jgi:uncharacterized protein (TIGR02147 family)
MTEDRKIADQIYLDYRAWVRETIRSSRTSRRRFTLEQISSSMGSFTKGHLSLILAGKRNLNEEKAVCLAKAIGLKGLDVAYFERLVRFNQAKSSVAKEYYLQQLIASKRGRRTREAPLEDARLLEQWHCLVILELLRMDPGLVSPPVLATRLRGLLTVSDVKKSLAQLEASGAIRREAGRYMVKPLVWRSSDEISSTAVRAYHRSCLKLADMVLDLVPLEQREFGALNVCLSPDGLRKVKRRLKDLREEILAVAAEETRPEHVCQFNFQFFAVNEQDKGDKYDV